MRARDAVCVFHVGPQRQRPRDDDTSRWFDLLRAVEFENVVLLRAVDDSLEVVSYFVENGIIHQPPALILVEVLTMLTMLAP